MKVNLQGTKVYLQFITIIISIIIISIIILFAVYLQGTKLYLQFISMTSMNYQGLANYVE